MAESCGWGDKRPDQDERKREADRQTQPGRPRCRLGKQEALWSLNCAVGLPLDPTSLTRYLAGQSRQKQRKGKRKETAQEGSL